MDPLASISLSAASIATMNSGALGRQIDAAGADPTPTTISAMDQGATQSSFSMGILKKTLDIQATDGAQLAQMLGQGGNVDITV